MAEYDFHTLSPADFEVLTCQLLRQSMRIELETFAHGPDGGVDLRCKASDGTYVVVQCKHYRGSSFSDLRRAARSEAKKMERIRPSRYIIVTSMPLSLTQKESLYSDLMPWCQSTSDILGQESLNILLSEYPQIERQNFKLWMASTEVLRRIIHSGLWERSEALVEEIQERVKLYVVTPSYQYARDILEGKHTCVISGAPGVGKSMLADMLTVNYWNEGWQIVSLASHELEKAWDAWTPDNRQLFYLDDVFGQTDVYERLANDSGPTLSRLIHRISKNGDKRLLITTRKHILHEAQQRDERIARAALAERECVLEVTEYDHVHKGRILYNHLYFHELDRAIVREISVKKQYRQIVAHEGFSPRVIDQVIRQGIISGDQSEVANNILRALNRPIDLWGPSFQHSLTEASQDILFHLSSFPVEGAAPSELRSVSLRQHSPLAYSTALRQLEGSWIRIASSSRDKSNLLVTFHDPSCRDFMLSLFDAEPDYFIRTILRSGDAFQVCNLLNYVRSRRWVSIKFLGAHQAAQRARVEIGKHLREAWSSHSTSQERHAVRLLGDMHALDQQLSLGIGPWVLELVYRLRPRPLHIQLPDFDSTCALLEDVAKCARRTLSDMEFRSFVSLVDEWLCTPGELIDWEYADGIVERLNATLPEKSQEVFVDMYHSNLLQWLTDHFNETLGDFDTEDDAREYLKEVATTVNRLVNVDARALLSNLEGVVEGKYNDFGDYYYGSSYHDEDETDQSGERIPLIDRLLERSRSEGAVASDDANAVVDDLFRGLS